MMSADNYCVVRPATRKEMRAAGLSGKGWAVDMRFASDDYYPGVLARRFGPRMGLSARMYRTYLDGHDHAAAITTDLCYRPPYPVTLAMVGITGPLGSHRYIEVGR